MEIFLITIAIIAGVQFIVGLIVWSTTVSEARKHGLNSGERRAMKVGFFATVTAPLSVLIIPIVAIGFAIKGIVILNKTTREHWTKA